MRRLFAAVAMAGTLVGVLVQPAFAAHTVWFVDDDGLAASDGCNGSQSVPTTIQGGVDEAAPGDTVKVCPGTYVGTVNVSKDDLYLTATAPWVATIKAPTDIAGTLVYLHDASHMRLRWFQIVAGTTAPCGTPDPLVGLGSAPDSQVRANHLGLDGPRAPTAAASSTASASTAVPTRSWSITA